jgi:hypothetical protein
MDPATGRWYSADDVDRLVRTLDVAWNGESGAAPQAMLCDIVGQITRELASDARSKSLVITEATRDAAVAAAIEKIDARMLYTGTVVHRLDVINIVSWFLHAAGIRVRG